MKKLLLSALFLTATSLAAEDKPFTIDLQVNMADFIKNCSDSVCLKVQDEINTLFATLKSELETAVNAELPKGDLGKMGHNMANAAVMASKGQSVDYGLNKIFVIGLGVGLGLGLGDTSIGDLASGAIDYGNLPGFGMQASVMAGVKMDTFAFVRNMKPWDLKLFQIYPDRFTFYVNWTGAKIPSGISSNLKGDFNTFGVHAQYQMIKPWFLKNTMPADSWLRRMFMPGIFNWTGVMITSGVDYTSMRFQFLQTLNRSFTKTGDADVDGASATLKYDGAFGTGMDVGILTIPIEISTGYQAGWIWEQYVGAAVDTNFGKADLIAAGGGFVSGSVPGFATVDGTSKLNLGGPGNPAIFTPRLFTGFHIKLFGAIKAFVHGNWAPISNAWGVNLGVRGGW